MDADDGLNGSCPTARGVAVVCAVAGALIGAVALAVGFIAWALAEEFKEGRWARHLGEYGRPPG